MFRTALLIPVYNEGGNLEELYRRASAFISTEDIIIVDDGSSDGCCDFLMGENCRLVDHEVNCGKGQALLTGFKSAIEADYDYILSIDADGQHDPSIIPDFLTEAEKQKLDLIIGRRRRKLSEMPWDRIFSNTVTSFFLSLISGQKIYDAQCGFRMYRLKFIRDLKLTTRGFDTENEILLRAFQLKAKIGWVRIPTIYNDESSHINRASDTWRFIILIMKYLTGRLN